MVSLTSLEKLEHDVHREAHALPPPPFTQFTQSEPQLPQRLAQPAPPPPLMHFTQSPDGEGLGPDPEQMVGT